MKIRVEKPEDYASIYAVHIAAFNNPYEPKLVNALRESDAYMPGLSLVATMGEEIIGHILFSLLAIVDNNGQEHQAIALAPLAVLPAWQSQGVGTKLVQQGLAAAAELGNKLVVVVGHPGYYSRFGFVRARLHGLECHFRYRMKLLWYWNLCPERLRA